MFMQRWMVVLMLTLMTGVAHADSKLSVEAGWVRWVPPVTGNSAAYFTLHNEGDSDKVLVAAESAVAKAVELHTVVQEGELMRMQPLQKLAVPAHDCVVFQPGSHHVMLIGLTQPLQEGQSVAMTLRFADGETLPLTLTVTNGASADDHAHHH